MQQHLQLYNGQPVGQLAYYYGGLQPPSMPQPQTYLPQVYTSGTSGRGDSNTLLASRRHQHKSAPYNSTKYGTSGDLVSDMATGKKMTQNETLVIAHLVNMRSILAGLF